jgi:hypothetical protein
MNGNTNNESKPRQIKDAPFCWQHKGALTMIRDVFENGHGIAAIPISVYVALTELASDAQSETFSAPISEIARRACVSYRTAFSFLKRFEDVKLIAVNRSTVPGTKEHAPSTYTMLCTPCLTLCKRDARRLPKGIKNQKNQKNDDTRTRETAAKRRANKKSSSSNLVLSLEEAKKHPLWPEFAAYCESKGGSPDPKGFFNTWLPKQSKARVAKAFAQDRDKIMAQRHDLVSQYCNGALTADERIHAFRRFAPLEVQQEYNLLGSRLQGAKPNKKGN